MPLSVGDPTLADAILGQLVHNAYQLNLNCLGNPHSTDHAAGWRAYRAVNEASCPLHRYPR